MRRLQTSPKRTSPYDLKRLVGSVNQLRFNDNRGEVSFFGQKMIILRRDVIRVMREGLERLVGEQAAPFLSYLASGVGVHEGSIFRDSVNSSGTPDKASMESLVHSALEDTNLGLGKIRVSKADFEEGSANVAISNCFEALENGPSEVPNCMFTSGFLAGIFAEVFDKTVQAVETQCISQGQPECEFQISLAEAGLTGEQASDGSKTGPSEASEAKSATETEPPTSPDSSRRQTKTDSKSSMGGSKSVDKSEAVERSGAGQAEIESGVERASRIARRKQHFWERWFKKN